MENINIKTATDVAAPAVILVKSQLAENIGMAARAMKNCGLKELRLVAPEQSPDIGNGAQGFFQFRGCFA